MKEYKVNLGEEKISVWAQKHKGVLWYHYLGETRSLELKSKSKGKTTGHLNAEPGIIRAPMPGKITKVSAKKGESVKEGQTLLVMEAMKMEYSLEADLNGEVKEIKSEVDQQVALGEVLARIEASGSEA